MRKIKAERDSLPKSYLWSLVLYSCPSSAQELLIICLASHHVVILEHFVPNTGHDRTCPSKHGICNHPHSSVHQRKEPTDVPDWHTHGPGKNNTIAYKNGHFQDGNNHLGWLVLTFCRWKTADNTYASQVPINYH